MRTVRLLLLAASLVACGGTDYGAARRATLRPLEAVRAQQIVDDALASRGLRAELHHHLRLAGRHDIDVDAMIAGTRHGIDFVTGPDRTAFGAALPQRRNPDALVVAPGAEADHGADVLVLDDQDYLYEPDPNRQGPGHPTLGEVEDRLRRAVIDYLTYLRDNHQL